MSTSMCAYQGVGKVSFLENFPNILNKYLLDSGGSFIALHLYHLTLVYQDFFGRQGSGIGFLLTGEGPFLVKSDKSHNLVNLISCRIIFLYDGCSHTTKNQKVQF